MKRIGDKTVNMVLTDPPYGTTACKWDNVIPFEPMWKELKRISKGSILLFGNEPFSSTLRLSNIKEYRYDWVWEKERGNGFANAKKQPLKAIENVMVFYKNHRTYNPQMTPLAKPYKHILPISNSESHQWGCVKPAENGQRMVKEYTHSYPKNIVKFAREHNTKTVHPTQKPVALLEYLIKTYTLEGETVLDFTMGSGSTGVACKNLNRKFIGIEKDKAYFDIAKARINGARPSVQLDMMSV